MGFSPLKKNENLLEYSKRFATFLFKDIYRDTGLPYTKEHLEKIANRVYTIILPHSGYKETAASASWLHDGPEDIIGLDVFDPSEPRPKSKRDDVFLNDIVKKAGEPGKSMCYMVDKLTYREGAAYQDYFNNIFKFPRDPGLLRDLSIITAIVKMVDRKMNINPDDKLNVDNLVRSYASMKDASQVELEMFYKSTKTIDAFRESGGIRYNPVVFVETLHQGFKAKQESVAIDNLSQYLPLAEKRLLVDIGKENKLFNWIELRKILKECLIDSLRLYPGEDKLHVVKKLGANKKAPEIEGYKPILKEIREEVVAGKYSI